MEMVSRGKLAEEIGITQDTLRGWHGRYIHKGQHYVVVGKTTLYDREEVMKWLRSRKESSAKVEDFGSEYTTRGRPTRKLMLDPATMRTLEGLSGEGNGCFQD
jgi:hypothetical protein